MTSSSHQTLERIARRVPVPEPAYERLLRRRDRKERNRRLSAGALAIIFALVSFVALARAFDTAERPADEPPKPPGIFSEIGGWITYGSADGIWAVDPGDREGRVQLSFHGGTPLEWSSDGSELLISRGSVVRYSHGQPQWAEPASLRGLFVLHADGSETHLVPDVVTGASFSPGGTTVVFAPYFDTPGPLDPGIYVIDADGGAPRLLLAPSLRYSPELDRNIRTELSLPTFSPDGTEIAYIDGNGDWGNSLRVMNVDGGDVHTLDGSDVHLLVAGKRSLGGNTIGLSWSPDGTRLAVGVRYIKPSGIYVIDADGSGATLTIPDGVNPHWSPDGSRISFERDPLAGGGGLQIADPEGRHVRSFGYAASGPWNPLAQPEQEPEVAEVAAASEGLTLASTLLLMVALLVLVAGAVLIRRRMGRSAGNAIGPRHSSAP